MILTRMKNKKNIVKFIEESSALQEKESRERGYIAWILVQTTMPHSKPKGNTFTKHNGYHSLTMIANPKYGLPYGSLGRLLMIWTTTEAVRTQKPELILGDSLSEFMWKLGLVPTGGRWGSITRLKMHLQKYISCTAQLTYDDGEKSLLQNIVPVDKAILFWTPKNPGQTALFESTLILSQSFFEEIIKNPIVFHMDTLKLLTKSPMQIDIYIWATYKNYRAHQTGRKKTYIPWDALQLQFGAGYPLTPRGKADFKHKFFLNSKKVAVVYPQIGSFDDDGKNLIFYHGYPDVSPKATKS